MACITKKRGRMVIDFYDQNGKRRLKTLPIGINKTDARKILADIEREVENETYRSKVHTPKFIEVAEAWLEFKKPNVRENVFVNYETHVRLHLKPFFGNMLITKVNFDSIEKYIHQARAQKTSSPTLRKILVNLGQILKYAVRKKYIASNPIVDIEKPKKQAKAGKKIDFLKPHEIRALLENTSEGKIRMLFLMAVMTGMRQGELLGLQWGDIDWLNNQVCVKRTYNHARFYEPKTEKSYRKIDLAPIAISELKKWKLQCRPNEIDLVFPNEEGNPICAENMVKRDFKPALRRSGIREIRFHDLRHTYASLLIDQGEHPKYIQGQMGHASINITFDTYGHLMKDVNSEAPLKLQNAIFNKNGDILETFQEKDTKKALKKSSQVLENAVVAGVGFEPTTFGL